MMVEEIGSLVEPGRVLHKVIRSRHIHPGRVDVSGAEEPLQVATIRASGEPQRFQPHYHIPKECPAEHVTQEAWVVIEGTVEVRFYDLDGQLLREVSLKAGDATVTFAGGHGYDIDEDAVVYEFKTGPYHGRERDKRWLGNDP